VIFRRELAGLFLSPLAWIVLLVAVFANGAFFVLFLEQSRGDLTNSLSFSLGGGWPFWAFLVFLPPLLTMRMLSEEARSGTLEYLLTAPVTDASVVAGKFLAATLFFSLLWATVPYYAWTVQSLGTPADWGGVLGNYIGAILTSALFVAIGLFMSSFTDTPLLAAFLAFVASLVWLLIPVAWQIIVQNLAALFGGFPAWLEAVDGFMSTIIEKMNVIRHFQSSFRYGVLDTGEFVFFLSWTAFFLFMTVRALEMRRWRG